MKDYLTKRQIEFLRYVKIIKLVMVKDIKKFYTTSPVAQFKRLIELGYLIEDKEKFGYFKYTGKEFE